MRWYLLFAALLALLMASACSTPTAQQATHEQYAIERSTQSLSNHVETASTKAVEAKKIATGIPAAAPVVAPIQTVVTELDLAKIDLGNLKTQHKAEADTSAALVAENATLKEKVAALEHRWKTSWFAGKFWFYFVLITSVLTLIVVGLFVAEFLFGAYVHPFTWIAKAVPLLIRGVVNVICGIVAAIKALLSGTVAAAKATVAAVKSPEALKKPSPPGAT